MGPVVGLLILGVALWGGPGPFQALWDLVVNGHWSLQALGGAGLLMGLYLSLRA